ADAAGLPILGICRGAQALNVARGGTLHQHLPAITDHSIGHRQTDPGWVETHPVHVAHGSRLGGVQWHAETLDRGSVHPRLFDALVAAAAGGSRLDLAA